jgi:D-threonate/D-erythronate kinase
MHDFFLADDLSGALDAAAAFHRIGRTVSVELPHAPAAGAMTAEVVGITTETRNATPDEAAMIVREAIARGSASGGRLVYKKIDSTLRGPIVAELAALLAMRPAARLLFSPANPRVGRFVRDGVLWVNDRRVAETEFARDPVWPVRESSIRVLLESLPSERIVIADAESDDDLRVAVQRMVDAGHEWVGVGSGALAVMVAETLGMRPTASSQIDLPAGPILMICGSAHSRNRQQAEILARERGVPVHMLDRAQLTSTAGAVITDLRSGPGAIVLGPADRTTSAEALHAVTAAATEIINGTGVRRVFITGGETGYAVCGALGIATLEFRAEIEPGVALSMARFPAGPMFVAMKPGGFGTEQTWVRVWDALAVR